MTIKVRVGGATREITAFKVKTQGVLRTVRTVKVWSGGVLQTVYSSAGDLTASVSPTSISVSDNTSTVTTDPVTVTPSGGLGPYTYNWVRTAGSGSLTNATFATTAFYMSGLSPGALASGTFQCTVTDSLGATATASITAEFERTE